MGAAVLKTGVAGMQLAPRRTGAAQGPELGMVDYNSSLNQMKNYVLRRASVLFFFGVNRQTQCLLMETVSSSYGDCVFFL